VGLVPIFYLHDYMDVGGRATQEQLPRDVLYVTSAGRTGRLQGCRRYDYKEVIGRAESGTEAEKTYGTGFRETNYKE